MIDKRRSFRKEPKGYVHLSELEFKRDSTELKRVWLCARYLFISSDSRRNEPKKTVTPSPLTSLTFVTRPNEQASMALAAPKVQRGCN